MSMKILWMFLKALYYHGIDQGPVKLTIALTISGNNCQNIWISKDINESLKKINITKVNDVKQMI